MLLTPAGQQLQQAVQPALAAAASTAASRPSAASARDAAGDVEHLCIFCVAERLVPRLALFQRLHPGIEIRLDAWDRVVNLQAEDVDLAIRWGSTGQGAGKCNAC